MSVGMLDMPLGSRASLEMKANFSRASGKGKRVLIACTKCPLDEFESAALLIVRDRYGGETGM